MERSEKMLSFSLKLRSKGPKSLEPWPGHRESTFQGGSEAKLREGSPSTLSQSHLSLDPVEAAACDLP